MVIQNVVNTSMRQMKIDQQQSQSNLSKRMIPILCCGESETYEAGKTAEWIEGQITAGLDGLTDGQVK